MMNPSLRCLLRLSVDAWKRFHSVIARKLGKSNPLSKVRSGKKPTAVTKIEWGIDMDEMSTTWSIGGGAKATAKRKGRCLSCWGGLIARSNDSLEITGIKCRVCGRMLEGKEAKEEERRASKEGMLNLMNLELGNYPKYEKGVFAEKVFPELDRLPEQEFRERIRGSLANKDRMRRKSALSREDFPAGTPGMLYLQAKVLMAGVQRTTNQNKVSVVDFPYLERRDDGSLIGSLSLNGMKDDPQYHEYKLMGNLGQAMMEGMISAFACELALKAICLTCNDEALKTHDLLDLFNELPQVSKNRIRADYADIEGALREGRQTFGKWRYFETSVDGKGFEAMFNVPRARNMGRAARVILDDAEVVGLGGSVKVAAKESVRVDEANRHYKYNFDVTVRGNEWPPRNH